MSVADELKKVEAVVLKTVEERLYLIEQALERALGVKLGQFDPNPVVAAAALAPVPAVEAPAEAPTETPAA